MYKRPLYIIYMLIFFLCFVCCHRNEKIMQKIDLADKLIEELPDSSLKILSSISLEDLQNIKEKARYSLLMSMALDKNFIDTTTFDVLQPAIDYYLKNGSPDDILRTFYYQGRIYQNQGDLGKAMSSYFKAIELATQIKDSLVLARTYVAQGVLYMDFHDYNAYILNFEKAAELYSKLSKRDDEIDCLFDILNGYIILHNQNKSDSIYNILNGLDSLKDDQKITLQGYQITIAGRFGNIEETRKVLKNDFKELDSYGLLSLALAYNKVGENENAEKILKYINKNNLKYDTIMYQSIEVSVLKNLEKNKEALNVYMDLSQKLDSLEELKYKNNSKTLEEKFQLELKNQEEAKNKKLLMLASETGFVILILIILILLLYVRSNRIKNDLVKKQTKITEIENKNLKLEKEKLSLKAENLANKVNILEEEKESLKHIISTHDELPVEVQNAIKIRIEMLNSLLAGYITDNDQFEKSYELWVKKLTDNREEFMNSNRLAFQVSHPHFIKFFEDHGLSNSEINYVCLYALGLRGKEVGNYMKKPSHVNISSGIRKKLGIDQHETNIGIYVRRLLKTL